MSKATYPRRNLGPGEPWGREVEKFAEGSEKRFTWLEAAVNRLNLSISALQGALQQQITHPGTPLPRFVGRTLYVDESSTIPDNRDTKPVSAFGYSMNVSGSAVAVGHDISWSGPPSIIVSDGVADSPHEPGVILLGSDRPSEISSSIRNIVVGDGNQWVGSPELPVGGAITIGSGNRSNRLLNTILGHENEALGALSIVIGFGNQVTDVDLQGGVTIGNQVSNLGSQCTAIGQSLVDSGVFGSTAIDGSVYHDDCFALGAGTTEQRQVAIGDRHIELWEDRGHDLTPAPSNPLHGRVYYYEGDLWLVTASKRVNLSAGGGGGGEPGADGKSAYEVAVDNGFVGTEVQWLASLVGPAGDPGLAGDPGPEGDSAYQVAVNNGFIGTEQEWLESLVGPKGEKGDPGDGGGGGGADGKSAYEIAVENGFVGTEQEWLDSLVGPRGEPGIDGNPGIDGVDGVDGKSAYQVAVDAGFVGTKQEWLDSLKGPQGDQGIQGNPGQQGPPGESALATSGTVTLAAPSGGGEAEVGVTFPEDVFSLPPRVLVSLSTRVPHTATVNICADTITETGAQIVLNRSDDAPTEITWVAVPTDGDTPPAREPYPDTFYPNELYPA